MKYYIRVNGCEVVECATIDLVVVIAMTLKEARPNDDVVAYKDGQFVDYDIEEALAMKKDIPEYPFLVSRELSR